MSLYKRTILILRAMRYGWRGYDVTTAEFPPQSGSTVWWRNHYGRLEDALAEISRQVSFCNHGESGRGEALDKIDRIASDALRGVGPDA